MIYNFTLPTQFFNQLRITNISHYKLNLALYFLVNFISSK